MNLHPYSLRGVKCVIYLSPRVSTSLSVFSALLVGSPLRINGSEFSTVGCAGRRLLVWLRDARVSSED